ISDDHDGILELPDAAPVGAAYTQWASLDDPVLEVDLLPNRPDAAGINGIARDLAAAGPPPNHPVAMAQLYSRSD
ncbi:MAG: hypothetical protein ACRED2_13400, partial [Methylocella sp.]